MYTPHPSHSKWHVLLPPLDTDHAQGLPEATPTFLFFSRCFLIETAFLMRWYRSSGSVGARPSRQRTQQSQPHGTPPHNDTHSAHQYPAISDIRTANAELSKAIKYTIPNHAKSQGRMHLKAGYLQKDELLSTGS